MLAAVEQIREQEQRRDPLKRETVEGGMAHCIVKDQGKTERASQPEVGENVQLYGLLPGLFLPLGHCVVM